MVAQAQAQLMIVTAGFDKRMSVIEERVFVDTRVRKGVDFFAIRQDLPFDDNRKIDFFFKDPQKIVTLMEYAVQMVEWDNSTWPTNILRLLMSEDYMAQYSFPSVA